MFTSHHHEKRRNPFFDNKNIGTFLICIRRDDTHFLSIRVSFHISPSEDSLHIYNFECCSSPNTHNLLLGIYIPWDLYDNPRHCGHRHRMLDNDYHIKLIILVCFGAPYRFVIVDPKISILLESMKL